MAAHRKRGLAVSNGRALRHYRKSGAWSRLPVVAVADARARGWFARMRERSVSRASRLRSADERSIARTTTPA